MDVVIGGVVGIVIGAIVAVNIVIFAGIDDGYEASPSEVFDQNAVVATAATAALVVSPFAAVILLRRSRRHRSHR